MAETQGADEKPEYDKVTQASLNSLYVKAMELDRGHNESDAPVVRPAGTGDDEEGFLDEGVIGGSSEIREPPRDTKTHASDAQTRASAACDMESHASDACTHVSDKQ